MRLNALPKRPKPRRGKTAGQQQRRQRRGVKGGGEGRGGKAALDEPSTLPAASSLMGKR